MYEKRLLVFHENDIDSILKKLNLLEDLEKGKIKCAICGRAITRENIGGFFKEGKKILVVCNNPQCIREVQHHE